MDLIIVILMSLTSAFSSWFLYKLTNLLDSLEIERQKHAKGLRGFDLYDNNCIAGKNKRRYM